MFLQFYNLLFQTMLELRNNIQKYGEKGAEAAKKKKKKGSELRTNI